MVAGTALFTPETPALEGMRATIHVMRTPTIVFPQREHHAMMVTRAQWLMSAPPEYVVERAVAPTVLFWEEQVTHGSESASPIQVAIQPQVETATPPIRLTSSQAGGHGTRVNPHR